MHGHTNTKFTALLNWHICAFSWVYLRGICENAGNGKFQNFVPYISYFLLHVSVIRLTINGYKNCKCKKSKKFHFFFYFFISNWWWSNGWPKTDDGQTDDRSML